MRLSKIAYSISLAILQVGNRPYFINLLNIRLTFVSQLISNAQCLPQSVPGITPSNEPSFNQPRSKELVPKSLSDRWDMKIICDADGYPVQRRRIAEGIEFLRNRVTGSPSLGPIDFERVSCSHNSDIHWTNVVRTTAVFSTKKIFLSPLSFTGNFFYSQETCFSLCVSALSQIVVTNLLIKRDLVIF